LDEFPSWDAAGELQFKPTRTPEEVRSRKGKGESVPMDQSYHRSLLEIVRGIFVERRPEFDCVAGCLEEHLEHFQVQKHFGYYWHRSSLTPRKAAECLSPAATVSKYFGKDTTFEINETNVVPAGGGGFDPDFLFAYPGPSGREEPDRDERKKEGKPKNPKKKGKKKKKKRKKLDEDSLEAKLAKVTELGDGEEELLRHLCNDMMLHKLKKPLESEEEEKLGQESMAVAVTSLMHCHLEKAVKCVKVLDKLSEVRICDDQGCNLLMKARKVFEDGDDEMFTKPEAMEGVANAVIEKVCGDKFGGSAAALSTAPGFLAHSHGHEDIAEEFEATIQDPDGAVYYKYLLQEDEVDTDPRQQKLSGSEEEESDEEESDEEEEGDEEDGDSDGG
jgi:hypothetical protein